MRDDRRLIDCRPKCILKRRDSRRSLACTSTTGTPSRSRSFGTSIASPRRLGDVDQSSATTVGRPIASTWLTRYKFRSKLLASTIHSTASAAVHLRAVQQHVDGQHLVGRSRSKAVRSGQIHQRKRLRSNLHLADLFLNRHTRIVSCACRIPAKAEKSVDLPVFGLPKRATVKTRWPEATDMADGDNMPAVALDVMSIDKLPCLARHRLTIGSC